jgi:hypothetical protein
MAKLTSNLKGLPCAQQKNVGPACAQQKNVGTAGPFNPKA